MASAPSFAIGAMLPLLVVVLLPAKWMITVTAATSLISLAGWARWPPAPAAPRWSLERGA